MNQLDLFGQVDENLFSYGLLIGETNTNKIAILPLEDIIVNCHHNTIFEFFAAFYFLLMLNEGRSVEDLLDENCQKSILSNATFLMFCSWFLYSRQKAFPVQPKGRDPVCPCHKMSL